MRGEARKRPVIKRAQHGLEELTQTVLGVLQTHGRMTFEELAKETRVDHRRLYDIVNVLATTHLLTKGKRTEEGVMLTYGDGVPLQEPVYLPTLLIDIQTELRTLAVQSARLKTLEAMCEKARHAQTPLNAEDVAVEMDKAAFSALEPPK